MAAFVLFLVGIYWVLNGEPGWGLLFILVAIFG